MAPGGRIAPSKSLRVTLITPADGAWGRPRMARREHARILGDVLDGLSRSTREGRATLAGLAARANLPHDRLVEYLGELRGRGLVGDGKLPALTARGDQFLACYRAWMRIQVLYGLSPARVDRDGVVTLQANANDTFAPLKGGQQGLRF